MPPYTERFVCVSKAASSLAVVFTVPAGKRAIVQSVTFADRAGVANLQRLLLTTAGDDVMLFGATVPAGGFVALTDLRTALYAGETLTFYWAAAANCTVSGYLFDDV